jgi:multidrug resistance efflux pump
VQAGATAAELATAKANVSTAQQALDKLKAGATADQVATAQATVEKAQSALDELKAGPTAADISAAQATVATAQNSLDTLLAGPTAADLADAQTAVEKAQSALDELKAGPTADALATAQNTVDKAQNALTALKKGATPSEIAAAEATLAADKASLATLQEPATASELAAAQKTLLDAQVAESDAEKAVDTAVIKAPFSGIVSTVTAEVNGQAANGGAALSMYDPNGLSLTLDVGESDVDKVKVGQMVNVTFDAISGQTATGTVTAVAPASTSGQDVVTYAVSVQFDAGTLPIKVGMNATGDIVVESKANAIRVPTSAIRTVGNTKTIEVLYGTEKTPVTVRVETGLVSGQFTEIVSCVDTGNQCLQQGDTVAVTVTSSSTTQQQNGAFPGGAFPGGAFPGGGFQFQRGTGGTNRTGTGGNR